MRSFNSLLRRLRSLFNRDESDLALTEELHFHLQRQVEENIVNGMSPEEAQKTARSRFGDFAAAREQCFEARGVTWAEDLLQDLRYGLRTLAKQRSFSAVTVLTLALGVGACTAIFSLVNAVLIRSLPYGEAQQLVYVFTPNPKLDVPPEVFGPSNGDFADIKKQNKSFSAMTLFDQQIYSVSVGNDAPVRIGAAKVDESFFPTLAALPELGRGFSASDEQPGKDHEVIISYALWQQMFGGNKDVLGQSLRLDGRPFEVIGIMPPDFEYPRKTELSYGDGGIEATQLWVPRALTPRQALDRDGSTGDAIARLRPGVTAREAQAELSGIVARLVPLHHGPFSGTTGLIEPFREHIVGPVRPLMFLLTGAVGFVFLIACGNAANLLAARAANRTQELGVRATLGARRGRLIRQMLTESLLLSVAAGVLGAGLAYGFLQGMLRLDPGDIPRLEDATLDLHVLAFLLALTMFTGAFFGIVPAVSASRINLAQFLKSGGVRGLVGDRRRARNGLVVLQIALVLVLLTGAGLLLRSYARVLAAPTGFSNSTVALNVALTPRYDTPQKQHEFFAELLVRLRALRGVEYLGLVNHVPLTDSESLTTFSVEGYANRKDQLVEERRITPDYLAAMQTPLLRGRDFTEEDGTGKAPVTIVNEALVKQYFAGREALGRHVRRSDTEPWSTVVGVATDVRNESLEAAAVPQMYTPFFQGEGVSYGNAFVVVRSSWTQQATVAEIRASVRSLDPNLALSDVHAMGDLRSQAVARRRFQTTLLTAFSGVSTLLAVVGVYGLLTYSVRRRTGEIGLRMALGSSRTGAVRLVLREALGLFAIGLALGIPGALLLTHLLRSFLYGVPVLDPVTFTVAPILLLLAMLLGCVLPSLRAAAINPLDSLRQQ